MRSRFKVPAPCVHRGAGLEFQSANLRQTASQPLGGHTPSVRFLPLLPVTSVCPVVIVPFLQRRRKKAILSEYLLSLTLPHLPISPSLGRLVCRDQEKFDVMLLVWQKMYSCCVYAAVLIITMVFFYLSISLASLNVHQVLSLHLVQHTTAFTCFYF